VGLELFQIPQRAIEFGFLMSSVLLVLIARRGILHLYYRRKGNKKRDNFVVTINQLSLIVGGLLLFFGVLKLMHISIREFFTSLTIFAAALALIFKDYVSNALNGMILMFSDTYSIGDRVRIGQHKGKIENINLLNLQLLDDDDDLVLIPNNIVLQMTTVNYSKNPGRFVSLEFELHNTQIIPLDDLEKSLIAAISYENELIKDGSAQLRAEELIKGNLLMRFRFEMLRYDKTAERRIKQRLWLQISECTSQRFSKKNT
jgi:small-conductance mechanosensitive channel